MKSNFGLWVISFALCVSAGTAWSETEKVAPAGSFATKQEMIEHGKAAYDTRCIYCHGATGEGDGPAAKVNGLPPGDLSNKAYMKLLSDQDLYDRIAYGKEKFPFIQMPGWASNLSPETIKAVVAYIRTFEVDKGPLKGPTPQVREAKYKSDPTERGRFHYQMFCSGCHGEQGDGRGWAAHKMQKKPVALNDPLRLAELTEEKLADYITGRKQQKDARNMPIFETNIEDKLGDILLYLQTWAVAEQKK